MQTHVRKGKPTREIPRMKALRVARAWKPEGRVENRLVVI